MASSAVPPPSPSSPPVLPSSSSLPPFSSLPSSTVQALLEAASDAYEASQSKAAECVLVAFQSSSAPQPHCAHLLAHSSSARVLFTALTAVKEATLKEWWIMDAQQRAAARDVVFSFLSSRSGGAVEEGAAQPHVLAQALHVLVLLIKRQWVDARSDAWMYIQHVLRGLSALALQCRFLSLLLAEFSVWHSTALGISMEAHLQCHVSFEHEALLALFSVCLHSLRSVVGQTQGGGGKEDGLPQCLAAMERALSWEFNVNFTQTLQALSSSSASTRDELASLSLVIEPGEEWRAALTQPSLVELLVRAHRVGRRGVPPGCSSAASQSVLRCLVHLASIKGPIFQQSTKLLSAHLHSLIAACSALLRHQRSAEEDVRVGVSAVLCRLWDVHGLRPLVGSSFAEWLCCLYELTMAVLQSAAFSSFSFTSDTSTALAESLEQMLGTWASLIMAREDGDSDTGKQEQQERAQLQHAHALITSAGEKIFAAYVDRRMARRRTQEEEAEAEDQEAHEQFAGEDNEHEHVAHLAFLARVHPAPTLALFQGALARAIDEYLSSMRGSLQSASSHTQAEQLTFLFRLLLSVLTDRSEREVPLLLLRGLNTAEQLQSLHRAVAEVVRFLSIACNAVETGRASLLSPLLVRSALELINEVSRVYLQSDAAAVRFFPSSVLDPLCLALSTSCVAFLVAWPGEQDVHINAARTLTALGQHDDTRQTLLSSPAYQHLAQLFVQAAAASPAPSSSSPASRLSPLESLDGESLALLVGLFLQHSTDDASLLAVLTPIRHRFASVLSHPLFASSATYREDPSTVLHLSATLHMLTGVVDSTSDVRFDQLFAFLSSLYLHLQAVLRAYLPLSSASALVLSILELFTSMAARQLNFMDQQQATLFLHALSQLVQLWLGAWKERRNALQATAAAGARSASPSPSSSSPCSSVERVELELAIDAYRDEILAILRLLSAVVEEDVQSAGMDSVLRAGDVCLLALTQLGSDEWFVQSTRQLVDVRLHWFRLIQETLSTHTQRFSDMQRAQQETVVRLVLDALRENSQPEVLRLALQAIQALAAFHWRHPAGAAAADGELPRFLSALFHCLLYQPVSSGVVDALADALLPCILGASSTYVHIGRGVIQRYAEQHGAGSLEQLERGFQQLSSGITAPQPPLAMATKLTFRKNVKQFISTVRVILQSK